LRGGGEGRGRGGGGGARAVLNTSDGLQETARDHVLAGGPLTSAPRAMPSKMQGRTAILLVLWQGIPCRRRGSNPASFIPLIQVRVADGDAQQASPGTLNLLGPPVPVTNEPKIVYLTRSSLTAPPSLLPKVPSPSLSSLSPLSSLLPRSLRTCRAASLCKGQTPSARARRAYPRTPLGGATSNAPIPRLSHCQPPIPPPSPCFDPHSSAMNPISEPLAVARHGEAEHNPTADWNLRDPALTEEGRRQAKALRSKLHA
jgi:hypothetical protein